LLQELVLLAQLELEEELQVREQRVLQVLALMWLHRLQLLQALLRQERFDQSVQQSFAEFRKLAKGSLYQPCQLKLLGAAHQH
jgi:IS4 transposase